MGSPRQRRGRARHRLHPALGGARRHDRDGRHHRDEPHHRGSHQRRHLRHHRHGHERGRHLGHGRPGASHAGAPARPTRLRRNRRWPRIAAGLLATPDRRRRSARPVLHPHLGGARRSGHVHRHDPHQPHHREPHRRRRLHDHDPRQQRGGCLGRAHVRPGDPEPRHRTNRRQPGHRSSGGHGGVAGRHGRRRAG